MWKGQFSNEILNEQIYPRKLVYEETHHIRFFQEL
jgi:hypothetical protein